MSKEALPIQNRAEVLDRLKAMGVVGAGGAGFPTHVKLAADCKTVIINGAECEPLLESDKYLLARDTDKVLRALDLAVKISGAERGVLGVKGRYKDLVARLKAALRDYEKLELFELENYYPAGDEHSLVREITGVSVPPAGIPIQVGCIVQNVETMRNLYQAVFESQPVTARFLTCGGEVNSPAIVHARIGTSFREVIAACGGTTIEDYRILVGGPLMGEVINDPETPVTKLSSGIIVLPPDHPLVVVKTQPPSWVIKQSKTACCQCTLCTELCPRYLLGHELYPHKIMRQINLGLDIPEEVIKGALLCSECGVCEAIACPMMLSPRLMNRMIKARLRAAGYKGDFSGQTATNRETWEYRKIPTERAINRLQLSRYDLHPTRVVENLLPRRVEIMLKQHIGAPAEPLVRLGDKVKTGELIADVPAGSMGVGIHASIDGQVIIVDKERVIIETR